MVGIPGQPLVTGFGEPEHHASGVLHLSPTRDFVRFVATPHRRNWSDSAFGMTVFGSRPYFRFFMFDNAQTRPAREPKFRRVLICTAKASK